MSYKKIIPYINAEKEAYSEVLQEAKAYSDGGADELLIFNYTKDEQTREEFLGLAKEIAKVIDVPFYLGCHISRLEDVKKALYTGANGVLIRYQQLEKHTLIAEAAERFGSDKIIIELTMDEYLDPTKGNLLEDLISLGAGMLHLKDLTLTEELTDQVNQSKLPILIQDSLTKNNMSGLISLANVTGVVTDFYKNNNLMKAKINLKHEGVQVNTYESSLPFSNFKLNSDGLIPVITQDYKTGEVLMLAYMNEEAYNSTIATGRMTYFSRSRQSLWLKGETSGHFQYVKELTLDCDKDTLLAKVKQIGPACHTGNNSCFFTSLVEKEYNNSNPFRVFEEVFGVILERKMNPKEGSYTNYLFDKGIDKILKKCGEEATEIIIAAKNPNAEELRYEISDFLYHMMVLMAECGLDWTDITTELANRK